MVNRRIAIIVASVVVISCMAGTIGFAQQDRETSDKRSAQEKERRQSCMAGTIGFAQQDRETSDKRSAQEKERRQSPDTPPKRSTPPQNQKQGTTSEKAQQKDRLDKTERSREEKEEPRFEPPRPEPVTAREQFSSLPRFGANIFGKVREPKPEPRKNGDDHKDTERKQDRDSERDRERDRQRAEDQQQDQQTQMDRDEPGADQQRADREQRKKKSRYRTSDEVRQAPVGSPLANVPLPPDYQLGPADTLKVQIWNRDKKRAEKTATVTADGYITLPVLGKLTINGMTMSRAREHIRKRATEFYSAPEIVMELVRPRTVDVYVIGDVIDPGKYSLPGNATVFTALYAAGGPSETGSYRRIKLTRAAGGEERIDLYEYLMYGRREGDELLQAGDTVFVPPVEREIAVAGAVRRPARYEILDPMTLQEAIDFAAGFTPDANKGDIAVWRPDDQDRWELVRADATTKAGRETPIANGALIDVSPILDRAPETVTLKGPVQRPGVYEVTAALTVGELIERAQGPKDKLYMGRGDIWRLNDQYDYELVRFSPSEALAGTADPSVKPGDIVYLYDEQRVTPPQTVEVTGEVRKPGVYPHVSGMRVRDLILRAGDVLPGAYMPRAEITRVTEDQREQLIAVDLQKALSEDEEENVVLKPQDALTVLSRENVADASEVHISGFVREPGTYRRYEGMHVSDLIMAAGGLTPDAGETINYTPGHFQGQAESEELSIHGPPDDFRVEPDLVLKDDDSIGVSGLSDFTIVPKMASIKGQVARPGAYPLNEEGEREQTADTIYGLIKRAGGLLDTANPEGMILYRLRKEIIGDDRQSDLNYIFQRLNREKEETMAGFTSGEQAEIIANSAAKNATSEFGGLLGTDSGALVVVPPRKLSISRLIRAVPINGAEILQSEGEKSNLKLHQGDVLRIPKQVDFVTIVGSVSSPGAVQFTSGANARDYIDHAGGALPDADMSRIIVMRANSAVMPAKNAKNIRAGDVIIVPSEHMFRAKHVGKPWMQSLTDLLSIGATALLF